MNQKQRLESLADTLIPEAIEWVKELRAYRVYQGKDTEYFRKARTAVGVIGGAVRLCATIENSRSNDLIEARVGALEEHAQQQLAEANK
jgi:hypothetical protein